MKPNSFQINSPTREHAAYLATAMVRRTCHALLPILKTHESQTAGPLSHLKVKMMDEVGSPESPMFPTVQLSIPPHQQIPELIANSLDSIPAGNRESSHPLLWIFWDWENDPVASHRIIQYVDMVLKAASKESHASLIIGLGNDPEGNKPEIIELLQRHLDKVVPIFALYRDRISLFSNILPDSSSCLDLVATLASSSLCYSTFCKTLEAVRLVESEEGDDLMKIFQDSLFNT